MATWTPATPASPYGLIQRTKQQKVALMIVKTTEASPRRAVPKLTRAVPKPTRAVPKLVATQINHPSPTPPIRRQMQTSIIGMIMIM